MENITFCDNKASEDTSDKTQIVQYFLVQAADPEQSKKISGCFTLCFHVLRTELAQELNSIWFVPNNK